LLGQKKLITIHCQYKIISYHTRHAQKVTSPELFAIRCGISYAVNIPDCHTINIVTDALPAARRIFDSSRHPYHNQTTVILKDLRMFASKHPENRVVFWDWPSKAEWPPHHRVDNETKRNPPFACVFPCRTSWEFCRKDEGDSLVY